MRGERWSVARRRWPSCGSSPHARGTRVDRAPRLRRFRIIPACAGNASRRHGISSPTPDHPRMRGERMILRQSLGERNGSSPHARGTLVAPQGARAERRIIPACAGNAPPAASGTMWSADHPRMRGERAIARDVFKSTRGSSPHARGTPEQGALLDGGRRIIPACAGNAASRGGTPTWRPDHPRMRGERLLPVRRPQHHAGSSPHARGTRWRATPPR